MKRREKILFGALLVVSIAVGTLGQGVCHRDRGLQGVGVTCEVVTIPPQLCGSCRLRPTNANGGLVNCTQAFSIDRGCRRQLTRYARFNRCDVLRNEYVRDFSNPLNLEALDFLLYAMCEECCDCVRVGSLEREYNTRRRDGTLMQVERGNCGNHARLDICRVLPNLKTTTTPRAGPPSNLDALPPICDVLDRWWRGLGRPFIFRDELRITRIPPVMRRFLTRFVESARCARRNTWIPCHRAELAQGKLSP